MAAFHSFRFSTIQISVTFYFSFDFDRVCGLLHFLIRSCITDALAFNVDLLFKETRSVTINIFRKKYFHIKSFVKIELSYVFTINMFSTAETCMEQ